MRALRRTVPAPAGFGIVDLIGVPIGADVELDLRLESVVEGVLVSGSVTAPVEGECGRCLDPVRETLCVRVQELYSYPDPRGAEPAGDPGDEDGGPVMEGDLLDLEPAVRDALVLALPMTPLCGPDCGGLCAQCGERLDDLPDDHAHEIADPRWSALQGLLDPGRTAAAGTGPAQRSARTPDPTSEES